MSVNKVILVGRVGKDPETRAVGSTNVSKLSLATSEKYKDKDGNKQENTEWHNLEFWGTLSDIVDKWIKKGALIYVEGSIKTDSWEDNGVKKYATKIRVNQMTMLGGKQEDNTQQPTASSVPTEERKPAEVKTVTVQGTLPLETDDLPF